VKREAVKNVAAGL